MNEDSSKSILLRTFLLDRKFIIFIVRLNSKINYERPLNVIHFYERILFKKENEMLNLNLIG